MFVKFSGTKKKMESTRNILTLKSSETPSMDRIPAELWKSVKWSSISESIKLFDKFLARRKFPRTDAKSLPALWKSAPNVTLRYTNSPLNTFRHTIASIVKFYSSTEIRIP